MCKDFFWDHCFIDHPPSVKDFLESLLYWTNLRVCKDLLESLLFWTILPVCKGFLESYYFIGPTSHFVRTFWGHCFIDHPPSVKDFLESSLYWTNLPVCKDFFWNHHFIGPTSQCVSSLCFDFQHKINMYQSITLKMCDMCHGTFFVCSAPP